MVTERKSCLTINFTILIHLGLFPSSPTYQEWKKWVIGFQTPSAENLHFINSIFSSPITEDVQGGSYDKYITDITVKCNTSNHKSHNLLHFQPLSEVSHTSWCGPKPLQFCITVKNIHTSIFKRRQGFKYLLQSIQLQQRKLFFPKLDIHSREIKCFPLKLAFHKNSKISSLHTYFKWDKKTNMYTCFM